MFKLIIQLLSDEALSMSLPQLDPSFEKPISHEELKLNDNPSRILSYSTKDTLLIRELQY